MSVQEVKIAALKAHLSGFLRRIQAGEELIVNDRKTPIARIIPYQKTDLKFMIRPPTRSPQQLKNLQIPKPATHTDSLKYLLEDREEK